MTIAIMGHDDEQQGALTCHAVYLLRARLRVISAGSPPACSRWWCYRRSLSKASRTRRWT